MLARPALDRDLHRALVEAGYAPLQEYVGRYDMSERLSAPALTACLAEPGTEALARHITVLVEENERLRKALTNIVLNANHGPDPTMDGTTDAYTCTIDDIEAGFAALGMKP